MKPKLTCRDCGRPMARNAGSKPQGEAMCRPCRASRRASGERFCPDCKQSFQSTGRSQVCSPCAFERSKARAESHRRFCSVAYCGRPVRARGMCNAHYAEEYRRERNLPGWSGHFISESDRRKVYERDRWVCWLCEEPVDPMLPSRDRMSATLDHIVPRSLGGTDNIENLALAHMVCNARRGNRVELVA